MNTATLGLLLADLLTAADPAPDVRDFRIQSKAGKLYLRMTVGELILFAALPQNEGIDLGEPSAITETALRQRASLAAQRVTAMNKWITDPRFRVTKMFATRGEHSMTLLPKLVGTGKESTVELTFSAKFGSETAVHEMGHAVLWPHEKAGSKTWRAVSCLFSALGKTRPVEFSINGTPARPRPVGYLMFDPVRWQPGGNRAEHSHNNAAELWASAFEAYNVALPSLVDSITRAKVEDPAVGPAGDDLVALLQSIDPLKGNGTGLDAVLDRVLARPECSGALSVAASPEPEVLGLGTVEQPTDFRYLLMPQLLLRDGGKQLPL